MGDRRGREHPARAGGSGLYHLAVAVPEAELIPVRLVNLNRVLPKDDSGARIARLPFKQPVALQEGESRASLLERARAAVVALDRAVLS